MVKKLFQETYEEKKYSDFVWGFCKTKIECEYIKFSESIFFNDRQRKNISILIGDNIPFDIYNTVYLFLCQPFYLNLIENSIISIYYDRHEILQMFFNVHSLDLIFNGDLSKYPGSINKVDNFIARIKALNVDFDHVYLDSTATLGLFGIRPIGDLDFLSDQNFPKELEIKDQIENNNKYLDYHTVPINYLLHDDKYFMKYKDLKVITLDELSKWKMRKGTKKDIEDVFLIKHFQNPSNIGKFYRFFILLKRFIKINAFNFYKKLFN